MNTLTPGCEDSVDVSLVALQENFTRDIQGQHVTFGSNKPAGFFLSLQEGRRVRLIAQTESLRQSLSFDKLNA